MTLTTAPLRTAADAACARDGVDETGLARPELLSLMRDVEAVRKAADMLMAQAAAEVDRRSRLEHGHSGLAAREGFRSAKEMIARTTGGSMAEAQRLVDTGSLLADAGSGQAGELASDGGQGGSRAVGDAEVANAEEVSPLNEATAAVARHVREGRIGVDVAAMFQSTLTQVPDTERARDAFVQALEKAPGLPAHKVRELVWRAQAHADPQAWAEREQRQYAERAVTVRDDADGMVTLHARLTPIDAAPVKAVLDAGVRRAMQQRRDDPESDPRSPWQMRADILTDLCRHLLDCEKPTSGVKTTVVVRMTRDELESGLGVGEVDGLAQPVSAGVLRMAAADAEVIPAVLGGESEVLDWGRAKRLFTPAQRLALAECDGGCAWCHAPPSWCEAHHIRWWRNGAGLTDLQNGVLLCTRCHHRIHRDRWEISVRDGIVWFTPPSSVDPTQAAVCGGRARYEVSERELAGV